MKRIREGTLECKLSRFLFQYRIIGSIIPSFSNLLNLHSILSLSINETDLGLKNCDEHSDPHAVKLSCPSASPTHPGRQQPSTEEISSTPEVAYRQWISSQSRRIFPSQSRPMRLGPSPSTTSKVLCALSFLCTKWTSPRISNHSPVYVWILMEERLVAGGLAFQTFQFVLSLIIECEAPMSSSMGGLGTIERNIQLCGNTCFAWRGI